MDEDGIACNLQVAQQAQQAAVGATRPTDAQLDAMGRKQLRDTAITFGVGQFASSVGELRQRLKDPFKKTQLNLWLCI